jgi:hypothetical protein
VDTKEKEGEPEKLKDFRRNPSYERKVIAFYDILGWRSEIAKAGTAPEKIGELRRLILHHTRLFKAPIECPVCVSTFSDNVVISTVVDKKVTPYFLRTMAVVQLMTAFMGYLMRGGIAIGDIVHDDEVVFGPGLNRAYELESTVAVFPRIVLDPDVPNVGPFEGFHTVENGIAFLDPFTPACMAHWLRNAAHGQRRQLYMEIGLPTSERRHNDVPGDVALRALLNRIQLRLRQPLSDKDYEKVAWLYDRIAVRLGLPPAASYPRVRFGDV